MSFLSKYRDQASAAIRSVDTIIHAAMESYKNTGFNEISILSLSSSDYPHFEELVLRLKETFNPLGVNISVPSLRVNEQLRTIADLVGNGRRGTDVGTRGCT
ncbi:MAG: hypothetical protein R3C53_00235 [Pirellulaceae bacterium]